MEENYIRVVVTCCFLAFVRKGFRKKQGIKSSICIFDGNILIDFLGRTNKLSDMHTSNSESSGWIDIFGISDGGSGTFRLSTLSWCEYLRCLKYWCRLWNRRNPSWKLRSFYGIVAIMLLIEIIQYNCRQFWRSAQAWNGIDLFNFFFNIALGQIDAGLPGCTFSKYFDLKSLMPASEPMPSRSYGFFVNPKLIFLCVFFHLQD